MRPTTSVLRTSRSFFASDSDADRSPRRTRHPSHPSHPALSTGRASPSCCARGAPMRTVPVGRGQPRARSAFESPRIDVKSSGIHRWPSSFIDATLSLMPKEHFLNSIATQPIFAMVDLYMLLFPVATPGESVPQNPRVFDEGPRSFGSVDTSMPATYSGPYGVLLGESKTQIISIATDGANHLIALKPIG